ncbi:MAG: CvpA family protein [Planctomycetaceae bacterium]
MFYDALLLLILLYNTWRGAARGVTWQLAGIAAILLCFLFAAPLSISVAPMISLDPPLNRYVAMLAIYLAFSLGSFAVARMIRSLLESLRFQEYDRHLGGVMGFLKGATLCLVMTFFVVTLSESAREKVLRSPGGRLAGYLLYKSAGVLPQEIDGFLSPHFRKIEGELIEIAVEEEQQGKPGHPLGLPFDLDPRNDDEGKRSEDEVAPEESSDPVATTEESSPGSPRDAVGKTDPLWNDLAGTLVGRLRKQVSETLRGAFPDLGGVEGSAEGQAGPVDAADDRSPVGNDRLQPRTRPQPPAATPLVPRERRPTVTAAEDPEVDRLLKEIAQAFSGRESTRQQLQRQVELLLEGVPATLARQALVDWRADLYGTVPDPDPGTELETPLEDRILRQMTKSRIGLQDLPSGVQSRLKQPR